MDAELLRNNWALALAAVVGLVIALFLFVRVLSASARGQLRRVRKELAADCANLRKATAVVAKAGKQVSKLQRHADKVKPRHLQESKEALEDAKALAKIAHDKVLVSENHVRRVILEEFPPSEHQRLRAKYLPAEPLDKRPFSF